MNSPFSIETYTKLLQTLNRAVADRTAGEQRLAELESANGDDELDSDEIQERLEALDTNYQIDLAAAEENHSQRTQEIETRRQAETQLALNAAASERAKVEERYQVESASIEGQYDENTWIMTSLVDESADTNPKKQLETFKTQIERREERLKFDCDELKTLYEKATEEVQARRHFREEPFSLTQGPGSNREETESLFDESAFEARKLFETLNSQWLPRLLSGMGIIWVGLLMWLPTFGILAFAVPPESLGLADLAGNTWIVASAGATFVLVGLVLMILWFAAAGRTWDVYEDFSVRVHDALQNEKQWRKLAKAELARMEKTYQERHEALAKHRDVSLKKFTAERDARLQEIEKRHNARLQEIEASRDSKIQSTAARHYQEQAQAEADHHRRVSQIQSAYKSQRKQWVGEIQRRQQEKVARIQDCLSQSEAGWNAAIDTIKQAANRLQEDGQVRFPAWEEILAEDWSPPEAIPAAIGLGSYRLEINSEPAVTFPAALPFPHSPSFVLKTADAGRSEAVRVQQAVLLRLMSQLPPATVRLTICDPVGLGEPFSAFMHLADFDELLITNRIWTEASHIDEQLAKLTEHLENVFQKYLRNEFETIEEYNQKAGEVAEPYRILVVAGFPHGFSERSARRLASIAASGPRCGVYLLLSVDTRQPMPRGFELADVEANATVFRYSEGHFVTDAYGKPPLVLVPDNPPEPAEFTALVRKLGELSRSIRRVEVPFHRISPSDDRIWKSDSRRTVDVALGRSGATKLQSLELGLGTSQHVLLAGKTGSGKSTLLHVLITNLALNYSPAEIEFYLIDFKKGVEFKAYATLQLPHARVIAIESDREFGVSVLERMDGILKERGELFREHGVQDIQSYRNANPEAVLPRILLIVDEFQEFFTEDDRAFQTASLLLDRLVRQGRAFGIHVLLGSQTLGGAYSLARTTISQMAVRIALQCSETDAHLILSEDNTAARLLTRPGEAIYNDANGMLEGNSLFQIAWLGDEERDKLLSPLADRARSEGLPNGPMIVFEGNLPADPSRNVQLSEQLEMARELERDLPQTVLRGWLGEPVSITRPTSVSFRRQPGSHLIIVGNELPPALGLMTTCLIGLAAQTPIRQDDEDNTIPFAYLLNGHSDEADAAACWRQIQSALPHEIKSVDFHEVGETIQSIRAEITRRQEDRANAYLPMFVVIFDLSRFRDLAKSDDDFGLGGFGDRDKPASSGKLFGEILREGSAVGVHVIAWCNSYNNVDRALGRQLLKEFEQRVAFQMSPGDSSSLIDNPAAGRLGQNRALLYLDDQGTTEKFRPYGRPRSEWLDWVKQRLSAEDNSSPNAEYLEAVDDINDFTIR